MGDREVPDELSMERVEKDSGVALEERVFTVGEVVGRSGGFAERMGRKVKDNSGVGKKSGEKRWVKRKRHVFMWYGSP